MHGSAQAILSSVLLAVVSVACMPSMARAELKPEDILLVVNSRIPAGRAIAELYARERHIPEGRIVEIDVPPFGIANPPEEIAFDDYQRLVARPIRNFLTRSGLKDRAKCVVTFWGVPLRIGPRHLTSAELNELALLKQDSDRDLQNIAGEIAAFEKSAAAADPDFKPGTGTQLQQLVIRLQLAMTSIVKSMSATTDQKVRETLYAQFLTAVGSLLGADRTTEIVSQAAVTKLAAHPATAADATAARTALLRSENEMGEVQGYTPDDPARRKVRDLAGKSLGSLGKASIVASQIDSFRLEETEAALDNELSLLWWHAYPHSRWLNNPLFWRNAINASNTTPAMLMVNRIDGPSEMAVREMIKTSIKVEQKGLKGQVVLDARGKPSTDAYGQYDDSLRRLNQLLRDHTSLTVKFDDQDAIIPPHSLMDPIAVYCGWYSLRNYAPPGPFSPGAVGFHVASFELVSLHARGEHGWVRGLLSDGVCGTLGPVAEPYLHSFPAADEFFPLLLTGKMTLAEVYWRTTPMVSWMQDCVGDPLYTPFLHDAPLKVADLPKPLQRLFELTGSAPASSQPVR